MPFRTVYYWHSYGIGHWEYQSNAYCVNNTSASDYGKCYNLSWGKAVFVQTDTATYPTLACETDGTCTRYTSIVYDRTLQTVLDLTSVGRQLILYEWRSLTHTGGLSGTDENTTDMIVATVGAHPAFVTDLYSYSADNPRYGLYFKAQYNRYRVPYAVAVIDMWFAPRMIGQKLLIQIQENLINNFWYAGYIRIIYAYEASPLAIIPLSYDEYITYADIRSAFGYNANGIDQPGWNADDMMRVLKEVFPDRTWAVFDDRTYTLYLYGLTMDDAISLGFVKRLSPTTVKVLDLNKKSDYTRFKEFYTQKLGG